MMAVQTFALPGNRRLEIHYDADPINPRSWDNLGRLVCTSDRFDLGDKNDYHAHRYRGRWEDLLQSIVHSEGSLADCLPVYFNEHTGVYADGSAARQVGFIYVTVTKALSEYSTNELTAAILKRIRAVLLSELEVYSQFITGDVYGFIIYKAPCSECGNDEIEEDSCWGFYGSDLAENGMFDYLSKEDREFLCQQKQVA